MVQNEPEGGEVSDNRLGVFVCLAPGVCTDQPIV